MEGRRRKPSALGLVQGEIARVLGDQAANANAAAGVKSRTGPEGGANGGGAKVSGEVSDPETCASQTGGKGKGNGKGSFGKPSCVPSVSAPKGLQDACADVCGVPDNKALLSGQRTRRRDSQAALASSPKEGRNTDNQKHHQTQSKQHPQNREADRSNKSEPNASLDDGLEISHNGDAPRLAMTVNHQPGENPQAGDEGGNDDEGTQVLERGGRERDQRTHAKNHHPNEATFPGTQRQQNARVPGYGAIDGPASQPARHCDEGHNMAYGQGPRFVTTAKSPNRPTHPHAHPHTGLHTGPHTHPHSGRVSDDRRLTFAAPTGEGRGGGEGEDKGRREVVPASRRRDSTGALSPNESPLKMRDGGDDNTITVEDVRERLVFLRKMFTKVPFETIKQTLKANNFHLRKTIEWLCDDLTMQASQTFESKAMLQTSCAMFAQNFGRPYRPHALPQVAPPTTGGFWDAVGGATAPRPQQDDRMQTHDRPHIQAGGTGHHPGPQYPEPQYSGPQYPGAQYPGAQHPGAQHLGAQHPGIPGLSPLAGMQQPQPGGRQTGQTHTQTPATGKPPTSNHELRLQPHLQVVPHPQIQPQLQVQPGDFGKGRLSGGGRLGGSFLMAQDAGLKESPLKAWQALRPAAFVSTRLNEMVPPSGIKKALLIGINYYGTKRQLNGCVDDVARVRKLLTTVYGFLDEPDVMTVLTDDPGTDKRLMPTKGNIMKAMEWLVADAQPGDLLFMHYSGHGGQKKNLTGTERNGFDETIMPVDYKKAGHLVDDELHIKLVRDLPSGVKLICFFDCCHSGSGMDLPFYWDAQNGEWIEECYPKYSEGDVILFSSCQDSQTAADLKIPSWGCGGAMSLALVTALSQNPFGLTFTQLLQRVHAFMTSHKFSQVPQMSSTQKIDPANAKFNVRDIFANSNPKIGATRLTPHRP